LKKALVTGANGLLGRQLIKVLARRFEAIPTHNTRAAQPRSVGMNVADKRAVLRVLDHFRPDMVVHTAAETDVDRCETDRELAWSINAEGTGNVAEACRKIGAKLIYVSTDYVFDGNKGMYKEEDEPKPVNYYGLSKLRGEELVKKTCDAFVVARTSVLYGWHPSKRNYATWIMDSLKNRKRINVVTDHYNSPTYADDLAETISRVIERDVNGILHVSGKDRVSRYDFAMEIAEVFGLDPSLVTPVKMADLKAWVARRPRDSSLDVGKAENELGIRFPKVTESLIRMKRTQS